MIKTINSKLIKNMIVNEYPEILGGELVSILINKFSPASHVFITTESSNGVIGSNPGNHQ